MAKKQSRKQENALENCGKDCELADGRLLIGNGRTGDRQKRPTYPEDYPQLEPPFEDLSTIMAVPIENC